MAAVSPTLPPLASAKADSNHHGQVKQPGYPPSGLFCFVKNSLRSWIIAIDNFGSERRLRGRHQRTLTNHREGNSEVRNFKEANKKLTIVKGTVVKSFERP